MMRVEGRVRRRSLGYDSFADITDVPVAPSSDWRTFIDFDGELTAEEAEQVYARMTSEDDIDQERRAALRLAADAGAANLAQMLVAYMFGDPMPDAVPQT